MGQFILRRFGMMLLTALILTFIVFFLTNLYPNLEKLAKSEGNMRMQDDEVAAWLDNRGYQQNIFVRYGEWLGVVPGWYREVDGKVYARCLRPGGDPDNIPTFCVYSDGNWLTVAVSELV